MYNSSQNFKISYPYNMADYSSFGDISMIKKSRYDPDMIPYCVVRAIISGQISVLKYLLATYDINKKEYIVPVIRSKKYRIFKLFVGTGKFSKNKLNKYIRYAIKYDNYHVLKRIWTPYFIMDSKLFDIAITHNNYKIIKLTIHKSLIHNHHLKLFVDDFRTTKLLLSHIKPDIINDDILLCINNSKIFKLYLKYIEPSREHFIHHCMQRNEKIIITIVKHVDTLSYINSIIYFIDDDTLYKILSQYEIIPIDTVELCIKYNKFDSLRHARNIGVIIQEYHLLWIIDNNNYEMLKYVLCTFQVHQSALSQYIFCAALVKHNIEILEYLCTIFTIEDKHIPLFKYIIEDNDLSSLKLLFHMNPSIIIPKELVKIAIDKNYLDIIKFLLPRMSYKSLLYLDNYIIEDNNIIILEELLMCDVFLSHIENNNLLFKACRKGLNEIVYMLIQNITNKNYIKYILKYGTHNMVTMIS